LSSLRFSTSRTEEMREVFGERLQEMVNLAPLTSARIGGPADFLLVADSAEELSELAKKLWSMDMPFRILGGGSNVLVSDRGARGVVILNHARAVRFIESDPAPKVVAESGASLGSVSRRTVDRDWLGLEWGGTVPGTIGGAVIGNAGAHDGDTASCLEVAEILQRNEEPETWPVDRFNYGYRDSVLKRYPGDVVVLSATFRLRTAETPLAKAKLKEFVAQRQRTQPTGASWGSMFKNPVDKFAGRLIEAAGLKGLQIGGARISTKHANFFINLGDASASDVLRLVTAVRNQVAERFDVVLELEVELFGDWDEELIDGFMRSGENHS
jgi:UDP-N-acetylmuramate dehydrogenase